MNRLSHAMIAVVVVVVSLGMPGRALAQPAPASGEVVKQNKIGVDAAFVLPVDEYADGVDAALGLFGRFELGINPQLALTARIGFLYHILEESSDVTLTMIPLYGGIKYYFSPAGDGAFLIGELGLNNVRASISTMGVEISDSETKFSANIGAGFQSGKVSFRGSLFFTADVGSSSTNDGTNLFGLMANVGYDFAAL